MMPIAVLNIDWQTFTDGIALGAIYALMAVGIGLVFGVLRLVNFAYGQLVMAGAFTLALASQWGGPRPLLRRRARAFALDGPARLPAAAHALARGDARRDLCRRLPAAERGAA